MIYTFNSERSPILNSKELQKYFIENLSRCENEIIVCSAFIKLKGIEWFYQYIKNKDVKCRVVSRWDKGDLLSKVSDLEVYEFCKEKGWSFEILENLHAKFYLMDNKDLISGSLNLTSRGIGLLPISNKEFGFYFKALEEDLKNINIFLEDTLQINDNIYQEYKKYIETNKNFLIQKFPELPDQLQNLKKKNLKKIWVKDFLFTEPKNFLENFKSNDKDKTHDKSILNIYDEKELKDNFINHFRNLDIYKWFLKNIKTKENKCFYFGELTALIHNSLFDDPKPYRKDIKILQNIFLKYIEFLKLKEFKLERPNHSQKITYLN